MHRVIRVPNFSIKWLRQGPKQTVCLNWLSKENDYWWRSDKEALSWFLQRTIQGKYRSKTEFWDQNLRSISNLQAILMVDSFSKREIKQVGFPPRFYQWCWHFMKHDFLKVFSYFYHKGYLDWLLNTTFISLIPKDCGDNSVKGYKPILLLSGAYKVVPKVLSNRLKPALGNLISETQGTCIKGRQIQDIAMIVNELLETRKSLKIGGLMYKLDFYKAFDQVSWDCFDSLLQKFGFCSKWRGWLSTC